MTTLSNGLGEAGRYDEELGILEARLAFLRRFGCSLNYIDVTKANMAVCYSNLRRHEEALTLRRELYARALAFRGPSDEFFAMALNLALSLMHTRRLEEAKSFLREQLPAARRALGNDHRLVLKLRGVYAETSVHDQSSTRDNIDEAVSIMEVIQRSQRVFGAAHPEAQHKRRILKALETQRSSRA